MSKLDIGKEEFIRVGTTLYKLVNQPRLNGGYVKKRIMWNNETLRQDYGKHYLATVPKYDGFCTVPNHVNYRPIVDKFLNLYEPIDHKPMEGVFPAIQSLVRHIFGGNTSWAWTTCNCSICTPFKSCLSCCWYRKNATQAKARF